MIWPAGRADTATAAPGNGHVSALAATPGPPPAGRGRWRLLLHARQFANASRQQQGALSELGDARSRRLELNWCQPAKLSFTVDGHSPAAAAIVELMTEVSAWRWDDATGKEIPVFRGVITQAEDQLTEQSHTVNFVVQDYAALLSRRYLSATYTVTQRDQDDIANDLLGPQGAGPAAFFPGSYLPIRAIVKVNPDGSARPSLSGQLRDRTYLPGQIVYDALANLGKVINGFDWDVQPFSALGDTLRVFFPYQGVARSIPLVYGSSVSALTRSVNSADYANLWRVIGNNGSSDPAAPQLFSEASSPDANDVTRIPIGLWASVDNAADVSIQSTLDQQAQGNLALSGVVTPTYAVTLRPDAYTWGNPNMGDVVPLVVRSGRLNVNTTIRVLGITYTIADDGQEDVELTVGRPAVTLPQLLAQPVKDTAALTRR
jgi:hypothetical protein